MALHPGTRLGPYSITAQIGEGGMGQVYRARDTNLDRQVAIKVLPEAVASDVERLARFDREAKTLAALNHPNIAAIYGLERSGGQTALVMELVEGPTLADRIAEGPIPVDEALPIARQIAEALEAAHEAGIIHRDLKPANVKVRPDGTVKVLDFGLAKAMEPVGAVSPGLTQSPTITAPAMTQAGVILGTAAYMSPEQARGRPVNRRADIWAFGCVLFEMLTGMRAFPGDDVSQILARVIERDPDWSALPERTPASVRRTLAICLQKAPRQRLGDMSSVRLAMEGALDDSLGPDPTGQAPRRIARERMAWGVVVLALVTVAVGQRVTRVPSSPAEPTRLSLVPDAQSANAGFALSPDGRRLAYAGPPVGGGPYQLWLRGLHEAEGRALPGTDGAQWPFWKPDGKAIGFFTGSSLKTIDEESGTVRTLCEASARPQGGSWSPDDVILFGGGGVIQQVAATSGTPEVVRTPDASGGDVVLQWPTFLPDGRRYLYSATTLEGTVEIRVGSLDDPTADRALVGSLPFQSRAEYADGYLFYLDPSLLLVAHAVDPDTLTPLGAPVPLSREAVFTPSVWGAFSVSDANTLMFQTSRESGSSDSRFLWVDRGGGIVGVFGEGDVWRVALSRDGRQVAANVGDQSSGAGGIDIWLYDVDVGLPTRITTHAAADLGPAWSPNGRRIAFSSTRDGPLNVFVKEVGQSPEHAELVVASEAGEQWWVDDWSRDGRFLALRRTGALSTDVWVYSFADDEVSPLLDSRFNESQAQFSPDGERIAYTSNEGGRDNVYVRPFPGPGQPTRVSTASGGSQPRWRGDGRELYYLAADDTMMAVAVSDGGGVVPASSVPLFHAEIRSGEPGTGAHLYDVSGDGERFLVVSREGRGALSVLVNWSAEVE